MPHVMRSSDDGFRVVLLGNTSVGKTTLFRNWDDNFVPDENPPKPTLASCYLTKEVQQDGDRVKLIIWDTAGQERFRSLVPMYTRDCDIAVIMFAVDMMESVENLDEWWGMLQDSDTLDCLVYVVANKMDLENHCALHRGREWAVLHNFPFFEVSALKGDNVQALLERVVTDVMEKPAFRSRKRSDAEEFERKSCC